MKKYILLITLTTNLIYCESVKEIIHRCLEAQPIEKPTPRKPLPPLPTRTPQAPVQLVPTPAAPTMPAGPADDQPAKRGGPGGPPPVPVDEDIFRAPIKLAAPACKFKGELTDLDNQMQILDRELGRHTEVKCILNRNRLICQPAAGIADEPKRRPTLPVLSPEKLALQKELEEALKRRREEGF
ncbi:hypothetical protein A3F66_00200 [candidate division TM6 bacterium RIFCSPHIGHO2_12_FULL_32_22]|nr:MAG: hypothetical protein A3F66_00200 [candidate division TM6 bacterium RIFCSPHIGHO2_12_FULL_32_22]